MANSDSSQRTDGKKNNDSPNVESNLSGLKHALHGASYQLKLGIVVCLANAKKSFDPVNDFSFAVAAEDPAAGKFDDIVYTFKDGEKKGILKIQVKHKLGSPAPNITVKDFTTNSDTKNPFAILKYFTSFCDQQPSTTDLEGFVICTNADINEKAKNIWKTVERAVTNDSEPSLDVYVASLFDSIGGKYYQLDYDKLWAADGTYSNLYQLLRKCSKRARLAKLLVEATKPNKRITYYHSLFKEYRQAILGVIDRNGTSTNDSCGFTKEFLVLSSSNLKPGYEAFRKEFEDQYRQEYNINGSVWDDLRLKRVYVSNEYLLDEKNKYSSSGLFPNDDVDESFKLFCERLRLVCGTLGEHELDDAITKIWRNMQYDDNYLVSDQLKGYNEENIASERLFKTNFDWLMDPFAKPLRSDDIQKDLENIKGTLANMKLQSISNKLRKKVMGSPFRVSANALQESELHDQIESESILAVEAFDIQFGVTVLLDMLELQSQDHICALFLEDLDFSNNSDTVEAVFRCSVPSCCLFILCQEAVKTVQSIVRKWKKGFLKGSTKQVFILRKTSNISSDFGCFRLCDSTEESLERFRNMNISLCGTTIYPASIFPKHFEELPIEKVIRLLDWGKQIEENNEISEKYHEIKSTYVYRPWIDHENELKVESVGRTVSKFYKRKREIPREDISFNEITKNLKQHSTFNRLFGNVNDLEGEHEPIVGDVNKKVLILLGEAGFGKSTNLTWLAWHLRQRNPSSWVVRCNLSDHCINFKQFIEDRMHGARTVIDEAEAIRILYKLVCSSRQLEPEMAEMCSKCLVLSDAKATLNEDLVEKLSLSLNNSIQLMVFKEKFNAGELVLLLDGFDEIAPHYKEVVLKLLSHCEQFTGVRKLYLSSRPYGFKEQFETAFKDPSFFQLKPLSLEAKGSILYKMMKGKWHDESIDEEKTSEFYKSLCLMLLRSLGGMSDVPLNLMMSVDIIEDRFYHDQSINIAFSSKTLNIQLFETIKNISKASFIVEEFVKVKIRRLLYDKNGADKNVASKPHEMERFEKALEEAKLLHGLVALWVLLYNNERNIILSATEIRQAEAYMNKIHEGSEKTGIINGIKNGVPMFIHRTFAEYLAAWWTIQRQIEGNQQDRIKMSSLRWFWDEERKELREYMDTILAKRLPLHLAIIERDWNTVQSLLSSNPKLLYESDDGNRTPLHLLAFYYDFERNWSQLLPDSIQSQIINCRERIFGWSALDYAFHKEKPQLIFYLLHHGASLNVDILYEQVAVFGEKMFRKAAKYARFVMGCLSRKAIEYESHDACQKVKEFCDRVVVDIETAANVAKICGSDYENIENDNHNEISIRRNVIRDNSVSMLENVGQRRVDKRYCIQTTRSSYLRLELKRNPISALKFFKTNDSSILNDDNLWHCIVQCVIKNYRNEFKYFFDLYCSRFKMMNFEPCSIPSIQKDSIQISIRNNEAGYLIDYFNSDAIDKVCAAINNICWSKLEIPGEIVIDENILSLLAMCVATVRPSMLRYLKESCKLNLCAGIVYSLAMITNDLFSKVQRKAVIKPSSAYGCLLDVASNISDDEANKMLRLAISSNLYEFSKCLIERYNIDFQAVDELKGWNVFHLCVSNQRSFWLKEVTSGEYDFFFVVDDKTDLFRCMLGKVRDMDCFGLFDRKGRSILHLAMENAQRGIVWRIVTRKSGLNEFRESRNLNVDAIPNIILCYRAIQDISKSIGEKGWHRHFLCELAWLMARISVKNREESEKSNSGWLFLQKNAKELYKIAMGCTSLFLMYYFHREFPSVIPPTIYDADWLACTAKSLNSPDYLDVTKWLFKPNEMHEYVNLYRVVEECDTKGYDLSSVNLEKLVKQIEEKLSGSRSVEQVCKLKLLALAVCLKRQSMIKHVCETLNVNIDWKDLINIIEIVHLSRIDEPGTKFSDGCTFEKPDGVPIYEYLFERFSNLGEIDTDGENVLHLSGKHRLGCMAKFLIKRNIVNVMPTNEQNGWNIFHYYASSKGYWGCCYTENDTLLTCITKRVLEITSDDFPRSSLTESSKNKLNELCFNSNEGRKSVIHVAVEAGNIKTATYIIECRLGIDHIEGHVIRNSDECSRFRECYDELNEIAVKLPFNARYDYLLHCLAKTIHRFSPVNIGHITEQENEDHTIEDVCRVAVKRRSVSILDHLIITYENLMNQALARSSNREMAVCMIECIRQNRIIMFKVLVDHYRTLQGIQPRMEVEFEAEKNNDDDEATIDELKIRWPDIYESNEHVTKNRDYLPLLILSVAYGRLSMTRCLVEMLQLEVNKSLIVLIMKALEKLWEQNCKVVTPAYEYLVSRCEGNPNLLHLCIEAECYSMLKYLIKEKKYDPNEIDSDNGWNAGHYCVSNPSITSGYDDFTWLVEENDIDCFGVYDQNGRSVLHLALENGFDRVVEYILDHRLGIKDNKEPWYEWDLDKIEKHIKELQKILESLPENITQQTQKVIHDVLETLVSYLFNGTSVNIGQILNPDSKTNNDQSGKKYIEDAIREDSVWMLERVIQQENDDNNFSKILRSSYLNLALEKKSILVLKYFAVKKSFILNDNHLWECSVHAMLKEFKIEFKYFFDLYCFQSKIKDFQPSSIQYDETYYLSNYLAPDSIEKVYDTINNICWSNLKIPGEMVIDEKLLSLLVICVATVRPSMLRYLKESCKLNLCAGIVYSLAMITRDLFSKVQREAVINPRQACECLLDLAPLISDDEANKMLRLAISSNLYEFSKCLIERYNIDFQAVDESKGWNVFHLCVSNKCSIWVEEIASGVTRASYVDGDTTDLFRYMLEKVRDMDCFGLFDKNGRSILHLAMENAQRGIVLHIVTRKLGLNEFKELRNASIDAIPNIILCYRAIYEVSKSIQEQRLHYHLLCELAWQIARISVKNREESEKSNSGRLLLQENAKELYKIAVKGRSPFLMYYLYREFPSAIPPTIYNADWLACAAKSLSSPDLLVVTKWLLNSNKVDEHANLNKVFETYHSRGYDMSSVGLEELVKRVEAKLSNNRSVEQVCKLKLLAFAVCLKQQSMIRQVCETLNVNIDWKDLIEIMTIAHHSHVYERGSKYAESCAFDWSDFVPIYEYLFERRNLGEIDVDGANVLHLAVHYRLGCMAKFLIKRNIVNVMATNEQNGWNIFHYYASSKGYWRCCYTENDTLLSCITKRVLEITSDDFPSSSLTESCKNKLYELCFNSNEGRKSVIHIAVEAGNLSAAESIIKYCLGVGSVDKHLMNSDECSRFRKCYDELRKIAAQLPFNRCYDYLLHKMAISIHRFSPENIGHITEQENVEDHIVEDACRTAIMYRSVSTLEYLIIAYEDQMNQALARSTIGELIGCLTECLRRNRFSSLNVLVGHCCTLQGIQPGLEVEFEVEENQKRDEDTIDEFMIQCSVINKFTNDGAMKRDYLSLIILSVAYGNISMTRYFVEMLQLELNKSLIVLIMKALEKLWEQNCKVVTPAYEYLVSRCEGNPNLLHLCIQAECYSMLKYLIKEKKYDPNEIDSENGWNAGHYCVSNPSITSGYDEFTWLVEENDIDCFGVYDRNGRSVLHLALENGRTREVKYILNHRLGLKSDNQSWYEWHLDEIEKHIKELQKILESLPENIPLQRQQVIREILEKVTNRRDAVETLKQLFTIQT